MKHLQCRQLRKELDGFIKKERIAIFNNSDFPEAEVLSDEQISIKLITMGFPINEQVMPNHRRHLSIPCATKRWKEYKEQLERKKKNAKK